MISPSGPANAKIVIVGEAPGREEETQGVPFVGPSGKLLRSLLSSAGITPETVYLTNVLKFRPPNNDISVYLNVYPPKPGKRLDADRTWQYNKAEEELYNELGKLSPNLVIAVGGTALYALCRKAEPTKWRGSILPGVHGYKTLCTLHPAAALRNYLLRYPILHDLLRAKQEAETPDLSYPRRRYTIGPTFSEAADALDRLNEAQTVSFDIETYNQQISCISFSADPASAISVPFLNDEAKDYFTQEEEELIWRRIARLLTNPGVLKVAQNAIFDCTYLYRLYNIQALPVHDTMIAHGLLYPDFPKGLDYLTSTLTREPYYKDEGKESFSNWSSDVKRFWTYNAKDSALTLEAYQVLRKALTAKGMLEHFEKNCALIGPLLYMQEHGIAVNDHDLSEASERTEAAMLKVLAELHEVTGRELKPNSPKQLKQYFYGPKSEGGLGLAAYTTKGKVTVDDLALARLHRKGAPGAAQIREYRKLRKLKGTYLDMKFDPDNRFRCSYNPIGTVTGRLSSKKTPWNTGGNAQNIPKDMKMFMRADPGYALFEVDLSQAENRIVACVGPVPEMRAAFDEGRDIHSQTFAMMFGMDPSEVSNAPGSSPIGDGTKSQRQWGKTMNHSLNYGLGYKSFGLRFSVPEKEARDLVERYHRAYPGVRDGYHRWVQACLHHDRTLVNPLGRKRKFLDRFGDNLYKDAYAHTPQSTVGDIMNQRGILFLWEQKLPGLELINQVHDSLVFQQALSVGPEQIYENLRLLKESLEMPVGPIDHPMVPQYEPFSIPAEFSAGPSWGKKENLEVSLSSVIQFLESYQPEGDSQ